MEPGTPVLSLDWMTSPSCQEPGRSWPTKDTLAVAPEAHLPSRLLPARDDKGASCPQVGELMDGGGGRGGLSQAVDWLARCISGDGVWGEQDLNKKLEPQLLSQGKL